MPVNILRLRHWFAAVGLLALITVAGAYFYARLRVQSALKGVPAKIGQGIQQSAHGFTFSKSEQGHTLFKIQAREVVQFKQGGHAELRDVTITLYGRDASRFDQIYGSDFDYDPQSGNVSARGEVQIDLEANPAGLSTSDQSTPKELKNPIHLKTSGLVFNQKTQDAHTDQKVEFRIPQASGSAQGVSYTAKTRTLTLEAQIQLAFTDPTPATLTAAHGVITNDPKKVMLQNTRMQRETQGVETDQVTILLRADNNVDRVLADGNVRMHSTGARPGTVRADHAEVVLGEARGEVRAATLSGHVDVQNADARAAQASAGNVSIEFAANNIVTRVRADQGVKLVQRQKTEAASSQDVQVTAPAVNFFLAGGRRLSRAETSAGAKIDILPTTPATGATRITAANFDARFNAFGQLASVHGAPEARVVSTVPGKPDRVSTSDSLDAGFSPGGGIDAVLQQGNVAYSDGSLKAWADSARYTPGDQSVRFSGSARVTQGGMSTTAQTMRIQRATGDAFADGDVKTTYSELKAQPNGALLASSSPIHVTASSMALHSASAVATYAGKVRIWQDANLICAPKIDFDRDQRSISASGSANQSVLTSLVQVDKEGRSTPVAISSTGLSYSDNERRARFEGDVQARASDFAVTAQQMDVLLTARSKDQADQSVGGVGELDRIIARGQVRIRQTTRHAEGEQLTYVAAEDKFVLTGGPPSIFDAEHGKITGVSLTLFRTDDRVVVEGNGTSPSVTQTRVAR
jgi:lipopolysaccharide export system protein LptA